MIGVAQMLVRLIAAAIRANRLGARARPLADGPLVETIQSLARAWSMSAAPTLAEAERIVAPKVVGLLRPTILQPASAVSGLSAEELQMILVHELAHVRRRDMWIVLLQRLSESVLFYNPALWHLSRRISTLREHCCDDIACKTDRKPKSQLRYAAALLRLVELGAPEIHANETLTALAASGRSPSELRRRVARLLGEPLREPLRLTRGNILALATFAVLLALGPTLAPSQAQPANSAAAAQQQAAQQKTEGPAVDANRRFSFGSHYYSTTRLNDRNRSSCKAITCLSGSLHLFAEPILATWRVVAIIGAAK